MKKMFGVVVVLLILYIAFQAVYSFTVGHQISSYEITVDEKVYHVKETFVARHKSDNRDVVDKNNYYYEITSDDKVLFSFKIVGNYTGIAEYLKNLLIYKDENFTCAYPIFKDKVDDIDVTCSDNGDKHYLYGAIKGQDGGLDGFVASLKNLGYNHPSWDATNLETTTIASFQLYSNNITENQNLAIWQYKGFYRLTNRGQKYFALDMSDQYEPVLSAMVNQYYVVPDYKKANAFTRLFVTNLISAAMTTLDLGVSIPYDSFIQGIVDNKIYLIDTSNKIQYAIDIYSKETKIVGDIENSTKFYNNGKWEQKSIYEVIDNKLLFTNVSTIPEELLTHNAITIDEVGGETDGYYYLYIEENGSVGVYRVDKQNPSILTLLFRTPSINNIKYVNRDIYFISNDTLYGFRDNLGLRPLVKYSEFVFNRSNLYNVYINE